MRIAVIGSGYAGTTLAAGLAESGHNVTAVDIDEAIVDALNAGEAPIHEPGLEAIVAENAGTTLTATTEYPEIADAAVIFIAVQTPSNEDGSIDTTALRTATLDAVDTLIEHSTRDDGHVLVIKSTVTPPQVAALRDAVDERLAGSETRVELATNPEFLREGSAVEDFRHPDKIVLGVDTEAARTTLERAFEPIIGAEDPAVITTDPQTAMMIKYANNAFLAAKISLINDLGNICKEFGIDAYEVADAIGTDQRIGEQFLRSGVGYGGSCFPKDVKAIISEAEQSGYDPQLLHAAERINETQPQRMIELLSGHLAITGSRIAVLGLAFKPGTDDIRGSRAIPVIEGLVEGDADVVAYDPVATAPMRNRFPEIDYAETAADALDGADAVLILTAWDEFRTLDGAFDTMAQQIVIDGRRVIEPRSEMTYEGLTW